MRILPAHFRVDNQVLQFDVIFQVCHDHHDHDQDCAQAGYLDLHWWCLAFPLCLLESSAVCLFVCFVAGNDLLDGLIFKEVYVSKSVMSLVFNSTPKPDSDTSWKIGSWYTTLHCFELWRKTKNVFPVDKLPKNILSKCRENSCLKCWLQLKGLCMMMEMQKLWISFTSTWPTLNNNGRFSHKKHCWIILEILLC